MSGKSGREARREFAAHPERSRKHEEATRRYLSGEVYVDLLARTRDKEPTDPAATTASPGQGDVAEHS